MTPEQLMIPRYKVIADYPRSRYIIGEIVQYGQIGRETQIKYDDYPAIFKPLQWWEERKVEEMPPFIRFKQDNAIFKIEQWDINFLFGFIDAEKRRGCGLTTFKPEYGYEPATESEYLTYINSKNGQ